MIPYAIWTAVRQEILFDNLMQGSLVFEIICWRFFYLHIFVDFFSLIGDRYF